MSEDFLHFIWKYGLFDRDGMVTDTGEEVQVISMGEHNSDAGPDFLNARVRIGSTTWAGNVEMHLRSSDWFSHRHSTDKAYDNVVLHVVYEYDQAIIRKTGEIVPTVDLKFNRQLFENYSDLLERKTGMPCDAKIMQVDPLIIDLWINALVVERLQQKTNHIGGLLNQYKNNWEEVFFITLARTFGFGLNAVPFELMARSITYGQLSRHRDNLKQIEALIMGQAGFLEDAVLFGGYYSDLRNEYMHLKNKYNLKPIEKHLWKFLRLRPVNFPTLRLAQFSALIQKSEGLFSRIISCNDVRELTALLYVTASDYWNTHYTFDTPSPRLVKRLGNEAINTLIINAVVPFMFIYGRMNGNETLKERALSLLNSIPAEHNRIVNRWEKLGVKIKSAFDSQGVLQLVNSYCNKKHCLSCSIGTQIIQSSGV